MDSFGLPNSPQFEFYRFDGNSTTGGEAWQTWIKPLGKSRITMLLIGGGGRGGVGTIGANSTAGGGGGGGSGAQTVVEMPLDLLPSRLYISVGYPSVGAGTASYVSIQPNTTVNHIVGLANGGSAGGAGSGGTGGAGGTAGVIATAATMSLGWSFAKVPLAGQTGGAGGTTTTPTGITLPTTGLRVTGGAGGGGLPAAAVSTINGAGLIVPGGTSYFPAHVGGVSSANATIPPNNGKAGFAIPEAGLYFYGGTGGASTHGTATGSGLTQSSGGNGGIGSGGGGGGGALTSSTAGSNSYGGAGLVMFWCY